ncbi:class I adenylate-forming enzyme family protein [Solimonas sp. SE-A11]|uniref:class I adenylate-forming enzyme family protein n=1 Tax=Solimonas sp. SE-A11 TaxID=3054954 RepID=UPI00259CC3BF|nr:class I adenylate-forming enzyme family protein [Solimonas sp. SE-A11]MDM4769689.1 class I adenylate-forming enzyme family protein [Solimonas sp. SE-A11]
MNISTILDMAAEAFGDRIGVVSGGQRYTYAELREAAYRAARRFKASGAAYVALLDVNSPAAPVALFGAAYAGIPYVPLNYRLTQVEINKLLARVAPAVLVTSADFSGKLEQRADIQVIDRADFLSLPEGGDELPQPEEDPRAIAVQLFTSGTTGEPKAAILRHENLMSYIVGTVEFAAAEEDDAIIVTVPPYHIAGISAVLSSTYACRRMVQMENFEAAAWLEACRENSVSNAFLVPTMLQRIVDHLVEAGSQPQLPALRALAYGGGKMPLSTIAKAMQLFPTVDFTNAYGLTETSSTIAVLGPDDHRAAAASSDPAVQRRLASVGKPGAVEIEIRDESGKVLGAEEAGLVFVRGPQVSGEYLSLGSQLDADGWFPTKDRGYLDAEGYLFLDGRADDVIVRGGENISPGEIEDVLLGHPAVADVAVVAMPDEQWGEGVAAAVVLKSGASASVAELQELVKGKLRSSRVPQAIVFKDALPYNELGKVLRRIIRQEFV